MTGEQAVRKVFDGATDSGEADTQVLWSSASRASPPQSLVFLPLGSSELRAHALSVLWPAADKSVRRAACTCDDTEVLMSVSVCCFCRLFTCCVILFVQRQRGKTTVTKKNPPGCPVEPTLPVWRPPDRIQRRPDSSKGLSAASSSTITPQSTMETASGNVHDSVRLPVSLSASLLHFSFFSLQSCSIPAFFRAPQLNLLTCITRSKRIPPL